MNCPAITSEDKQKCGIGEHNLPAFVAQGEVWVNFNDNNDPWYAFFNCGTNDLRILVHEGYRWELTELTRIPNHHLHGLIWKWTLGTEERKQVVSKEPIVKVKDLIKRLGRLDPEATILLSGDFEGNYYKYIEVIIEELCIGDGKTQVDVYCEKDAEDLAILNYTEKAVVIYPKC